MAAGRALGDDEKNYKLWSCSFKFAEKLVQHPIKGRTIKHHQEQNFCKRTKTSFAAAISPECKLNKTMLKPPSALHHSHSAHHLDLTLLGGKSRPNVCPLQQHCFITSSLRCCSELGMGWLGMSRKKCMENISSILWYLCPTPWPWWGHGGMYPSCAGGLFKFLSQLRTSETKHSTFNCSSMNNAQKWFFPHSSWVRGMEEVHHIYTPLYVSFAFYNRVKIFG